VSGDIDADTPVWKEHAERNRGFDPEKDGLPASNAFPFTPRKRKRPFVGADIF